jgi:hypothetical protein
VRTAGRCPWCDQRLRTHYDFMRHRARHMAEEDRERGRVAVQAIDTLCEDCPPVGYPTDETRCTPCPRRQS